MHVVLQVPWMLENSLIVAAEFLFCYYSISDSLVIGIVFEIVPRPLISMIFHS